MQAASEVDSMQKELTQAKVVVEAATQDCNALLEVITTSTADVETKQAVAIAKEEELKVTVLSIVAAEELTQHGMLLLAESVLHHLIAI